MRILVLTAVLAFTAAAPGTARADIIPFTNSAAFLAALGGGSSTTQGYEPPLAVNSTIAQNGLLGGVTYTFSAPTLGGSQGIGRIDNALVSVGTQSLAIFRTTTSPDFGELPNESFFYPGESLTVTFPQPVTAVGIFFSADPFSTLPDDFFIQTAAGTARNGSVPEFGTGQPNPTLYFVGLISTTGAFTTATIGGIDRGTNGGFNLDNLTFGNASLAAVPEPGTLVVLGGLLVAGGVIGRRRASGVA